MTSQPIQYVVGFLFDPARCHVALIQKQRPAWQRGRHNGIGGKIGPGETPAQAMRREFREETGLTHDDWQCFAELRGPDYTVFCFRGASAQVFEVKTQTDEPVRVFETSHLPPGVVPILWWLIPMAQTPGAAHYRVFDFPGLPDAANAPDPTARAGYYWPLFEHLSQKHGLTLLDSELEDIIQVVVAMKKERVAA